MLLNVLTLAGALALGAPATPAPAPSAIVLEEHGKVPWFQGTFEQALEAARTKKQFILIDFWTDWCGWCKKLDKDTYSDASVVKSLEDVICLSIDAESETGSVVAKRFKIEGYPAIFVLDSSGIAQDLIGGYLPADEFKKEVARVRSGKGTVGELADQVAKSPKDLDLRAKLAAKHKQLGNQKAYEEQLAELKKLDPEGKSEALHRAAFEAITEKIQAEAKPDSVPSTVELETFLAKETYKTILWEGWMMVVNVEFAAMQQSEGDEAKAKEHKLKLRDALGLAFKHAPDEALDPLGTQVAEEFWADREALTPTHKATALDCATRANEASGGKDGDHLDLLARCQYLNGKTKEALETIAKAIEADGSNATYKEHQALFQTGK